MWLLLHGFTGSPASWERVLSPRDFGANVVAPFLMGHGPDWRRNRCDTFDAEVERLARLAATTDAPRFLAGYSLGARVALVLLARHPELFSGAVLVGARPGLSDATARESRRAVDAERATVLRRDGIHAFLDSWEKNPLFETQHSLPKEVLAAQRKVRESHEAEGLATSLEVLGLSSMPSDSAPFGSCPVTLMTGEADPRFTAIASQDAAQHANVRAVVVPRAGHNLILEAPGEVAKEMMRVAADARGGGSA